jgi:hypothetical protein
MASRFFPLLFLALAAPPALAAEAQKPFVLKQGQELTFAVTIVDGKATVGAPKLGKLGAEKPKDGEITVGLTPRDKDLYSQLVVAEKTAAPIDFVATGHIGEIVIDEREVCGRLEAPFSQRIGGTAWSVVIRDFSVGKGKCEQPALSPSELK